MKEGDLVRMRVKHDKFHDAKGIIVRVVERTIYTSGIHYEVLTFCGHTLIALPLELERLENEVEIPS